MKRREWLFQATSSDLAMACAGQVDYHTERLAWWEAERQKADEALYASGIQVRTHAVTGGERHEAVLDPTLTNRLGECEAKIQNHRAKSDEYAQWYAALKGGAGGTYSLDHDDWIFFFGLRGDEDE